MSPSESAAVGGQREDTTNTIYLQIIRRQIWRWNDSFDLSADKYLCDQLEGTEHLILPLDEVS